MNVTDRSSLNNIPGMVAMEPARLAAFAKVFETQAVSTLAEQEKKAQKYAAAARAWTIK